MALRTVFESIKSGVSSTLQNASPKLQLTFQPDTRLKLIENPELENNINNNNDHNEFLPVYSNGQNVAGHLDIILPTNLSQFEYESIEIYLVGHVISIESNYDDSVFLSHKISLLDTPGILIKNQEFDFKFNNPSLTINSFYGSLLKCRYFIRVIINRSKVYQSNVSKDYDFMVRNISSVTLPQKAITMEVGVSSCLHIKFHYNNINLSIDDCLKGFVEILSNNLKISTMQIQIIRREVLKTGYLIEYKPETIKTTTLGTYEIMDGFPGKNEIIPIQMFLKQFKNIDITQKLNKYFSVQYYLNLGLIDIDGRKYFKTCEINIFRTKYV